MKHYFELVWQSGSWVLMLVAIALFVMLIANTVIIGIRAYSTWKIAKDNRRAREAIWSCSITQEMEKAAQENPSRISELALDAIAAQRRFFQQQAHSQGAGLPQNAYLEREIRHSMGKIQSRWEFGMTMLATIGSTAPFIGLLGTVWGIYRALINISTNGQMSIAAVAGPIGEALFATALGLFAAIPAVLAYNFFTRTNKKLARQLHQFAHDLHTQLINTKE